MSTLDTSTLNTIALQLAHMQIKVCLLLWLKGFSADTRMKNTRRDDMLQSIKRKPEEEVVVYWQSLTRYEVICVVEMT
jgi:hypothetical protein